MSSRLLGCALVVAALSAVGLFTPQVATAQGGLVPALVATAPAGAEPDVLKAGILHAVPDDAMYLAVVNNFQETKATAEKVLRKLNIPFEQNDYEEFNTFVGKLQGWDKAGMHALAAMPDADGDVSPAIFVTVSNYKSFAKSIGADATGSGIVEYETESGSKGWIAEKSGYAVIVQSRNKALLERIMASKKSLADSVSPLRLLISKNQITGIALPAGVKKALDEGIKGLEAFKEQIPAAGPQAEQIAGVFEMYTDLLKLARDEVTVAAAGLRLDETAGLDIATQAVFKTDGKMAAASKSIPLLPASPLSGLPDGEVFIAGAGVMHDSWAKALMELSLDMSVKLPKEAGGYNLTTEQAKEIASLSALALSGIKQMSGSMSISGKTLFDGAYVIVETSDAKKFVDQYETNMAKTNAIVAKNPAATYPKATVERKQIDGRDTLIMTMDMSKMLEQMDANQPPQLKGMMESMFGAGGKVKAYLSAIDKETVLMSYSEDSLKQLAANVTANKAGLASSLTLKKTSAMLPAEAHVVAYLSIGGYIDLIKKVIAGAGFPFPVPAFPETPPVGFSGRLAAHSVETHIAVPMSLMEGIRDYVQTVKAQFGGAQ